MLIAGFRQACEYWRGPARCANSAVVVDLQSFDVLQTITDGARCFLAHQHQHLIGSLLATYPDAFRAHIDAAAPPVDPMPIAAITELHDQRAELDDAQHDKQPDWTFDAVDSGKTPVERLGSPAAEALR